MRKKRNRYRSDKPRRKISIRAGLLVLFRLFGYFAVVSLLSAAFAHSWYALLDAPWLRVNEIEIKGNKHLERNEILNTLGVAKDTCVLDLKVSEAASRLERLPWLKKAVVRLDPPGKIIVEVTEREPLAVVLADDYFLMDREGRLFTGTTIESNPGMLLITGFAGTGLKEGDLLPYEAREAIMGLLTALERSRVWLPANLVTECRWSTDTGFDIYLANREVVVRFGFEAMDQKLERLHKIFAMLGERGMLDLVTGIDLDYMDRAFIEGRFVLPPKGS